MLVVPTPRTALITDPPEGLIPELLPTARARAASRPTQWTAAVPFRATSEPILEYACHEGNYSMAGMLRGARAAEKAAGRQAP